MCVHKTAITNPQNMDLERFKTIINKTKPYFVTLSGYGEPLLNPVFFDMVRFLKKSGIGVNTTTNGFLLDRYTLEVVDSGIDQISISLDAATETIYKIIRRNDNFNKVIGNIRLLSDEKKKKGHKAPFLRGNFVIQNDNLREIVPFVKLAYEIGLDSAFFQPYMSPYENGGESSASESVDRKELIEILNEAVALSKNINFATNLPNLLRRIGDYLDVQYFMTPRPSLLRQCVKPYYSAYISVEGFVRPCCTFASVPVNMGNIFEDDIINILNTDKFKTFRKMLARGETPHWLCERCVPMSLYETIAGAKY